MENARKRAQFISEGTIRKIRLKVKKKEVERLEELKRHNEAQARLHVYAESIEADEGKMRSVPPLQHKQEHYLSQPSIPISLSLNRISLNQINLPILLKGFQSLKLMYLSQTH